MQDIEDIKSQKTVTRNTFKNEQIKNLDKISDVNNATLIGLIPEINNKLNKQLIGLKSLNVECNEIKKKQVTLNWV